MNKNIKISIITVVYNGEEFLEETILSVINQSYDNVEYIIIDGGSTDGTVDIIKKYENKLSYWISEKDKGIYDAMNKGIKMASGMWVNFMNAGDRFYSISVIHDIFQKKFYDRYDIIYGDTEYNYGSYKLLKKALSLTNITYGMVFCHQSTFIRLSYHKKNLYSLNHGLSGDYLFFLTLHQKNKKLLYIPLVISSFLIGGISNNVFQSTKERIMILKELNIYNFREKKVLYLAIVKTIIKKLLPKIVNKIINSRS